MPKRIDKKTGVTTDANDAEGGEDYTSGKAEEVRTGKLSAAQSGDTNIPGTDVIALPGYVETAAVARSEDARRAAVNAAKS